jgi:hypothetical protein
VVAGENMDEREWDEGRMKRLGEMIECTNKEEVWTT